MLLNISKKRYLANKLVSHNFRSPIAKTREAFVFYKSMSKLEMATFTMATIVP